MSHANTAFEPNENHCQILRHALGLERSGDRTSFRNRFSTKESSDEYPRCMEMVRAGLMSVRAGRIPAPDGVLMIFGVTAEGIDFITAGYGLSDSARAQRMAHNERPRMRA